jgi:type II secretory pathway pseudopilin PulG
VKSLSLRHWQIQDTRGDTIVEVLIAIAVVSFVLAGAYALTSRTSRTIIDTREHQQALGIAGAQTEYLRAANGLAAGNDCFATDGTAVAASTGKCSFDASQQDSCTAAAAAFCYGVKVTPVESLGGGPADPTKATTYKIDVTWDSLLGGADQVTLFYRIDVQNTAYVPPAGGGGSPGATVGPTPCVNPTDPCYAAGGNTYHFTGGFTVSTDVPTSQIASCVWDFGYPGAVEVHSSAVGCRNGDKVNHDFSVAPEMQSLPAWPDACKLSFTSPAGNGKGLGTIYTVRVTITETDGSKVVSAPYQMYMPACWYP